MSFANLTFVVQSARKNINIYIYEEAFSMNERIQSEEEFRIKTSELRKLYQMKSSLSGKIDLLENELSASDVNIDMIIKEIEKTVRKKNWNISYFLYMVRLLGDCLTESGDIKSDIEIQKRLARLFCYPHATHDSLKLALRGAFGQDICARMAVDLLEDLKNQGNLKNNWRLMCSILSLPAIGWKRIEDENVRNKLQSMLDWVEVKDTDEVVVHRIKELLY